MKIFLTAFLFVMLGYMCPVHMSFPALTDDSEGSGNDLEASGSGDWSDQGKMNVKDQPSSRDGPKNTLNDPLDLSFDNADSGSGFVVLANSKSFLENKEIVAGIIAGGVIGVAAAVAVGAILIYKWQKKDGGYIMGQQRASDDYH